MNAVRVLDARIQIVLLPHVLPELPLDLREVPVLVRFARGVTVRCLSDPRVDGDHARVRYVLEDVGGREAVFAADFDEGLVALVAAECREHIPATRLGSDGGLAGLVHSSTLRVLSYQDPSRMATNVRHGTY